MNVSNRALSACLLLLALPPLAGCGGKDGDGFNDPIRTTAPMNAPERPGLAAKGPEGKEPDGKEADPQTDPKKADDPANAEDLGIPLYPGAKALAEDGIPITVAGTEDFLLRVLETEDSREKVLDFYQTKWPRARTKDKATGEAVTLMEEGRDGFLRSVEVTSAGGKTRITLSRLEAPPQERGEEISAPPPTPEEGKAALDKMLERIQKEGAKGATVPPAPPRAPR